MPLIRFFDWSDTQGTNVAASTTNGNNETDCDCFNVKNPYDWCHWDVSIVKKRDNLSDDEEYALCQRLALLWRLMEAPKPIIDKAREAIKTDVKTS